MCIIQSNFVLYHSERPLMPSIFEVASTRKLRKIKPREHSDQHMRSTQAVQAVPQSRRGAVACTSK